MLNLLKRKRKYMHTYVKDIKEKMEDENFEGDKITIFSYLTKLRQFCLDPRYNSRRIITGGSAKIKKH